MGAASREAALNSLRVSRQFPVRCAASAHWRRWGHAGILPIRPDEGLMTPRSARTVIPVLVAAIIAQPCGAQMIQGTVVSEKSHSPIGSAHLALVDDVSKPVAIMLDQPRPRYPDRMRAQGRRGVVRAMFVVEPDGQPNMGTYQTIATDDPSFAEAVRNAVSRSRYYPAERDHHSRARRYAPCRSVNLEETARCHALVDP